MLSAKFVETGNGLAAADSSLRTAVELLEIQLIRDALARNNHNQTRAAADLGIGRRTLLDKLERYRIGKPPPA